MAPPQPHDKPVQTSPPGALRQRLTRVWLTGRWAVLAGLALLVLAAASMTDSGSARLAATLAAWTGQSAAPEPKPADPAIVALEDQTGRLIRAVQALAREREALLTRIERLEDRLAEVTGSVARLAERPDPQPVSPPSPVAPGFLLLEPALGLGRPPITQETSQTAWADVPLPRPALRTEVLHTGSVPQADRTERPAPPIQPARPAEQQQQQQQQQRRVPYGVDLGAATSVDGLRALWMDLRTRSNALATLTPAVARAEARPGSGPQMRLVAGPLPSAAAAARLCQALMAGRTACQPAVYPGQPLALR